ncbi:hypothetical protein CHEID_01625 [Corynebacterium heidelbergense]|nr:hypothetical protein CHEID_01625 [Corynebacterium heidelbergense]
MTQYRTAVQGLLGEFVSRRLLQVSLLLTVAAIPVGYFLLSNASQSRCLSFLSVVTGLASFSNAAIWARDPRLNQLLQWPVSRGVLARASLLAGAILFAVEFGVCQATLLIAAGRSFIAVLSTSVFLLFVYCSIWPILLLDFRFQWPFALVLCGLLAASPLVLPSFITWLTMMVIVSLCIVFAKSPPLLNSANARPASRTRNYYLACLLTDQRVWVNAVAVIGFGALFLLLSREYPLATPPGLSVCLSTSVLTTTMSRDPDTVQAARMLGVERNLKLQYCILLFFYYGVVATPLIFIAIALNGISFMFIPFAVATFAIVSCLFAICEIVYPLSGLRTEKEVLKHPRQYLVLLIGSFILVSGYLVLL